MGRRRGARRPDRFHGVVVINKPTGPTSAGCVNQIKRIFDQGKVGHAGTLDPMASGVLVVLLGRGTKIASYVSGGYKIYRGELMLGQTTDTYDTEGTITATAPWEHITAAEAEAAVLAWNETTEQEVPPYAAAKHEGQPLYKIARQGGDVPVKTKHIVVSEAEVLSMDLPRIHFRVRVSPGTYIRSLVHSLGMRLSCGAVMTALTREYSHPFALDHAHELDVLAANPETVAEAVIPMADALPHWPRFVVSTAQADMVRNGKWLDVVKTPPLEAPRVPGGPCESDGDDAVRALCLDENGEALAMVERQLQDGVERWAILRGLW
ncbi:tRNA pseudouridine(55) synthase TruB [Desulfovibrio inopinatus]|uniref:tRNA pseudouridine(55) synthase TruB n=1 Tax=Desulfovibrio inopinatus TaxID=102109 RepID=UPI0004199288|nr:tRNA pseudouridine(55) synthase TruB [Desulfovibrio inopinatus]